MSRKQDDKIKKLRLKLKATRKRCRELAEENLELQMPQLFELMDAVSKRLQKPTVVPFRDKDKTP